MGIRVMLEAGNDEAESNGSCPGFVEIELGNGDMLVGTAKNENGDYAVTFSHPNGVYRPGDPVDCSIDAEPPVLAVIIFRNNNKQSLQVLKRAVERLEERMNESECEVV